VSRESGKKETKGGGCVCGASHLEGLLLLTINLSGGSNSSYDWIRTDQHGSQRISDVLNPIIPSGTSARMDLGKINVNAIRTRDEPGTRPKLPTF